MSRKVLPLTIIHCFRSPIGGLFRHVCDLVRGQANAGHSIGIVCDSSTEDEQAKKIFEQLEALCVHGITRMPMSRTVRPSDLTVYKKTLDLCQQVKPDIIHGHGAKGGAYARLVASRCSHDNKVVYTPHGGSLHYDSKSLSGLIYLSVEKLLKTRTNGIIFESHYSANTYKEKVNGFPNTYRVIQNGLKENEFDAYIQASVDYDFVYVGELRLLKGIEPLLQAFAQLLTTQPAKLLVVGAGPDESYFREQIKKLGVSASVDIVAPIFPATDAFKRARCVVMPSLAESFPYIVLEALAAGAPLISTNVGGIPEIFGPYADDLLDPADKEGLTRSMQDFLDNPDLITERSLEIQAYIKQQFNIDKMLGEIEQLYYQLVEDKLEPAL